MQIILCLLSHNNTNCYTNVVTFYLSVSYSELPVCSNIAPTYSIQLTEIGDN